LPLEGGERLMLKFIFFLISRVGEIESTWHTGNSLAYCTSPV
jgi:hypothetical protein